MVIVMQKRVRGAVRVYYDAIQNDKKRKNK